MKPSLLLYALLSTLSFTTLAARQKWVYSERTRDRGGHLISDVIDIDAEQGESVLAVDGSGSDNDDQSGDVADDESSGDMTILSACELSRQQAVNQSRSGLSVGTFIPRCTADGYFEVLQCHSGTGDCWCVDRVKGLELIGSRRRVPSMPNCTRFIASTKLPSSTTEESLRRTTVKVIPFQFPTLPDTSTSRPPLPVSTVKDDIDNKIKHFPSDPKKKPDEPADYDNNYVELRRRKMSLRASVIGQPGILAGIICAAVVILLCLVLLVMFCVYRVHRKSQDPDIFYIDKTARMPLSTNKKVGYMKALNPDHDMYD